MFKTTPFLFGSLPRSILSTASLRFLNQNKTTIAFTFISALFHVRVQKEKIKRMFTERWMFEEPALIWATTLNLILILWYICGDQKGNCVCRNNSTKGIDNSEMLFYILHKQANIKRKINLHTIFPYLHFYSPILKGFSEPDVESVLLQRVLKRTLSIAQYWKMNC